MSAAGGGRTPGTLRSRASWVATGLILQAAGAGGVAAYVWLRARRENLGGHLTAATIRLTWHSEVHTRQGLAILAAGAVIYAIGSVVLARPYVTRPVTLFAAVPAAAIAGMLVLGVLAVIVTVVVVLLVNDADVPAVDFGGGGRRRKREPGG